MSQSFFKTYWQNKNDGGHRQKDESFLKKEAKEKLFHLGTGETLLDFGCGAAELTVYFCEHFKKVYGIDFSESMLQQARKRVFEFNLNSHVSFVHGSENNGFELLPKRIDTICCVGVVQHLNKEQIDSFISNSIQKISPSGKIVIFDAMDPRIYFLYQIGLFRSPIISIISVFVRTIKILLRNFLILLKILKPSAMGFAYFPDEILKIAQKYNLQGELVWSMYYEYRYHLILKPKL